MKPWMILLAAIALAGCAGTGPFDSETSGASNVYSSAAGGTGFNDPENPYHFYRY